MSAVAAVPWTRERVTVLAGLMLSILVSAIDTTIVATALPTIAGQLGGIALYPWVVAAYLLTSTTTVPLWGRLADMAGRRRVLLVGLALFVAASMLCGLAPSMGFLVAARALQGVGAGCLQPVTFTIVGDLFPGAQRARVQGFFSSMWAFSAVAGPLLGAAFVATIGWRWIFFVNLPIGLVAGRLVWSYREHRGPPATGGIDWLGALALTGGVAGCLLGLQEVQVAGAAGWGWPAVAAGAILLALFVVAELRVAAPVVPLTLLRHRVIGPVILDAVLAGAIFASVNTYVPLYVQSVLGRSPFAAGTAVAMISIGWPASALLVGRLLPRYGHRPLLVAGGVAAVLGCGWLLLAGGSLVSVAAACVVIGAGLGFTLSPILIVIQDLVEWNRRGAITAMNQLGRTLGGAIGVPLLGLVVVAGGAHLGEALATVFRAQVAIAAACLAVSLAILLTAGRRAPAPA